MSHYDYIASGQIAMQDQPFYALIMAAMRQADSDNAQRLKAMWPDIWDEMVDRYNAPGGILATDQVRA